MCTISSDNQRDTSAKVRLLPTGGPAVISDWDERSSAFETVRLLRNPELREYDVANLGNQKIFIRSQSVVARVIAGETLIVPVRAKVGDLASIYRFNGTGSLIWKLLEKPRTLAELAAAVVEEYDVDPTQAERDVAKFLDEMKVVGLVEFPAMAMAGD